MIGPVLSLNEAAKYLGLSRRSVGRLLARSQLAYYQLGGRKLVGQQELDNFLSRHRVPACERREADVARIVERIRKGRR